MCKILWISRVINVNFYQILVHVTVIFRNLIFVCIKIKDKLIKHLYNSHLQKLLIAHEVSVMHDQLPFFLGEIVENFSR